ncbi:hypothetical protein HDU76_007806 [Blyttiomyces sp. JEL0837]|nr:hypothetical protein HDU76_007806 [Blyttiomyces sp. JEL0837]
MQAKQNDSITLLAKVGQDLLNEVEKLSSGIKEIELTSGGEPLLRRENVLNLFTSTEHGVKDIVERLAYHLSLATKTQPESAPQSEQTATKKESQNVKETSLSSSSSSSTATLPTSKSNSSLNKSQRDSRNFAFVDPQITAEIENILVGQVRLLQQKVLESEHKRRQLMETTDILDKKIALLLNQRERMLQDEKRLNDTIWNLEMANQDLADQNSVKDDELKRLRTKLTALQNQIVTLEDEIQILRETESGFMMAKQNIVTRMESDATERHQMMGRLQREKKELTQKVQDLTSELTRLSRTLQEEIASHSNDSKALAIAEANASSRIPQHLEIVIQSLSDSLSSANADLEKLKVENSILRSNVAELEEMLRESQNTVQNWEHQSMDSIFRSEVKTTPERDTWLSRIEPSKRSGDSQSDRLDRTLPPLKIEPLNIVVPSLSHNPAKAIQAEKVVSAGARATKDSVIDVENPFLNIQELPCRDQDDNEAKPMSWLEEMQKERVMESRADPDNTARNAKKSTILDEARPMSWLEEMQTERVIESRLDLNNTRNAKISAISLAPKPETVEQMLSDPLSEALSATVLSMNTTHKSVKRTSAWTLKNLMEPSPQRIEVLSSSETIPSQVAKTESSQHISQNNFESNLSVMDINDFTSTTIKKDSESSANINPRGSRLFVPLSLLPLDIDNLGDSDDEDNDVSENVDSSADNSFLYPPSSSNLENLQYLPPNDSSEFIPPGLEQQRKSLDFIEPSYNSSAVESLAAIMVGSWFIKYNRFRKNPHMRFFWVNPYSRLLSWAKNSIGMKKSGFIKSAYIRDVHWIEPMEGTRNFPPNEDYAITIVSDSRDIMLVPTSWEEHRHWLAGLRLMLNLSSDSETPLYERFKFVDTRDARKFGGGTPNSNSGRQFANAGPTPKGARKDEKEVRKGNFEQQQHPQQQGHRPQDAPARDRDQQSSFSSGKSMIPKTPNRYQRSLLANSASSNSWSAETSKFSSIKDAGTTAGSPSSPSSRLSKKPSTGLIKMVRRMRSLSFRDVDHENLDS